MRKLPIIWLLSLIVFLVTACNRNAASNPTTTVAALESTNVVAQEEPAAAADTADTEVTSEGTDLTGQDEPTTETEETGETVVAEAAEVTTITVPEQELIPDPEDDDTLATIDLEAGFLLDPYILRVIGGGDTEAAELDSDCVGFVDTDPNAVLNWSGDAEQLSIFVYSDLDPVLVVQTPDGTIVCNDDANRLTRDPLVTLDDPVEGTYEVHVGSFEEDGVVLGVLGITELSIADLMAELDLTPLFDRRDNVLETALNELDVDDLQRVLEAVFGSAELSSNFETVEVGAAGGGDVPVFDIDPDDPGCGGFVSLVPTYSFSWSGSSDDLSVYYEGEEDTSLVLITPDGEFLCNNDFSSDNLNPAVDIQEPVAGIYNIFVASSNPSTAVPGTLVITTDIELEPAALSADSE